MRKLSAFNFITLNGFYKGISEDINWHRHGEEEAKFSEENLKTPSTLLFGRVTYDMMYGFWSSEMALNTIPKVANGMNNSDKIVFSNTFSKAEWKNTTLINGNIIDEVRKLKLTDGNDLTILGSGSIVSQFADAGLIDEYQIMIYPVAIGNGVPLFNNIKTKLDLNLVSSRIFKSGVVLLNYVPIK